MGYCIIIPLCAILGSCTYPVLIPPFKQVFHVCHPISSNEFVINRLHSLIRNRLKASSCFRIYKYAILFISCLFRLNNVVLRYLIWLKKAIPIYLFYSEPTIPSSLSDPSLSVVLSISPAPATAYWGVRNEYATSDRDKSLKSSVW